MGATSPDVPGLILRSTARTMKGIQQRKEAGDEAKGDISAYVFAS